MSELEIALLREVRLRHRHVRVRDPRPDRRGLVQMIGHLQWLLNVDLYRAQREFPEREALIRVCDPASWELLGAMIQELIDAHPGSPFVHLEADEAGAGACRPA